MDYNHDLIINETAISYVSEKISCENHVTKEIITNIVKAFISHRKLKVSVIYQQNNQHFYYLGYVISLKDDIVIIDHHVIALKDIIKADFL